MGLLTQFANTEGIVKLAQASYNLMDTEFFQDDTSDLTQFARYLQVARSMLPEEKYDEEVGWDPEKFYEYKYVFAKLAENLEKESKKK